MLKNRNTTIAKWVSATALAAHLLAGAPAHAGFNEVAEVTISVSSTSRIAYGSIVDARHSTDGIQYIGCTLNNSALSCFARNRESVQTFCTVTSPTTRMLHAFSAISETSYVKFTSDSTGTCLELDVRNRSQFLR